MTVEDIKKEIAEWQKVPCGCSGLCDEEGLTVEHQCQRCAKLQVLYEKKNALIREKSCKR